MQAVTKKRASKLKNCDETLVWEESRKSKIDTDKVIIGKQGMLEKI